jgi:hypothetical protein
MAATWLMMFSASAETGKSCVRLVPAVFEASWLTPANVSSPSPPVTLLAAASASSEEPPAFNTSLNLLNAVLSFVDASTDVLKSIVAFAIALKSPDSTAVLSLKADEANFASLLPVKEDAASNKPAVSPFPIADAALNNVAAVLTSGGTPTPPNVSPAFTTPAIFF